jgi:hypothetical protein
MSLPAPPPPASLPPAVVPLAAAPSHQVAQTALSTLLLSLPLPLLSSTRVASARRREKERLMEEEGLVPEELRDGSPAVGSAPIPGEDAERTAVKLELESLGFRVGGDLAERCVCFASEEGSAACRMLRPATLHSVGLAGLRSPSRASPIRSRSSSSSARTCGRRPSTSRSTICVPTTGCVR